MNRQKILQVNIDNDGGNGAFALIQYLYAHLEDDFIFDFFTMGKFIENESLTNMEKKGCCFFSACLRDNRLLGHLKLPFYFRKFLSANHYKTVHIHSEVAYKQFIYVYIAKKSGVEKIIVHSHSNNIDGNYKTLKLLLHKLLRRQVNRYGTVFLACSEPAAKWMFHPQNMKGSAFYILPNGIDAEKFKYNSELRNTMRESLGIPAKTTVLGHIGALKKVKNQKFLLEIMRELIRTSRHPYLLLLVGDGDDRNALENYIEEWNLKEHVILLGTRTDVSHLVQAFDIFVFPSLFEGIPMALIEAQAAGIPVLASDVIDQNIKVNDNVFFLPIKDGTGPWIRAIEKGVNPLGEAGYKRIAASKYNIAQASKLLKKIYEF